VEDNGPGIDPEICSQLFEPFFTTKDPHTGAGLGLFVSYFIITRNHGGTIEVQSRVGVGTTFTITLPLSRNDSP
jgi:signal transduction histidine kinase